MTGRTCLEQACPVIVLIRPGPGGGPRNILNRLDSGEPTDRPFRGLRRHPGAPAPLTAAEVRAAPAERREATR